MINLSKEILEFIEEELKKYPTKLEEAIKYLAELKYPVSTKKFDPTGSINQYHEAKRQGFRDGAKFAITSPDILKAAGLVKEEWVNTEDRLPVAYETGNWDGKRSALVIAESKFGEYFIARVYSGIIDGQKFNDWYDRIDFELTDIVKWKEI